jgi:DNA-binding protein HU-beta
MATKVMSKTQIAAHMAELYKIPKKAAQGFIDDFVELAVSETKKNGAFSIPGIGKLVKQQRKARMGRNPKTGEQIPIPAKTVVKMRLSKVCKDAIVPPKK